MNIQDNSYKMNISKTNNFVDTNNVSFKAGFSPLNTIGNSMQWIEDKGFLASFLIQDVLGMTAPRVGAAFLRDKEYTGEYNVQEGFEVLGREGLTGPCMMAVAPISFALANKFGKLTNVNTQFIKIYGKALEDALNKNTFDKSLLNDKNRFREVFYKENINKILNSTLGKENYSKKDVNYILDKINLYQSTTNKTSNCKKIKKEALEDIRKYINDIKYRKSSELESLNKVKLEHNGKTKSFSIKETFESLIKFADDAIEYNKNFAELDKISAEALKNKALAKRLVTNFSVAAATLGILSVLPKIYARNSIAPGAKKIEERTSEEKNNQDNISFKGKGQVKKSLLEKLGKIFDKKWGEKAAEHFEYNGHNFTNSLMACLSLGGLLAPRGFRAYERAQTDKNGKKDLTELYEIIIRDVTSSLAVIFAVPMLTRAFVTMYENNTGFVLMNKDRSMTKSKTILDLLNPYGKAKVLSNAELEAIYNNVNSKEKMLNFCDFINKNNGDLEKIFSKSQNAINTLKEKGLNLAEIKGLDRKIKNKKIIEFIKETLEKKNSKEKADSIVTSIMKGTTNKLSSNKILSAARNLNSLPGAIATFFITPYLLGWIIPRLTYANTRRIHNKADIAEETSKETK